MTALPIFESLTHRWPLSAEDKAAEDRFIAEANEAGWVCMKAADHGRRQTTVTRLRPAEPESVGSILGRVLAVGLIHKRNKQSPQSNAA